MSRLSNNLCFFIVLCVISVTILSISYNISLKTYHDDYSKYENSISDYKYIVNRTTCMNYDKNHNDRCIYYKLILQEIQTDTTFIFSHNCILNEYCINKLNYLFDTFFIPSTTINIITNTIEGYPCLDNSFILRNCPEKPNKPSWLSFLYRFIIMVFIISLMTYGLYKCRHGSEYR